MQSAYADQITGADLMIRGFTLRLKTAQKPCIVMVFGPKSLMSPSSLKVRV